MYALPNYIIAIRQQIWDAASGNKYTITMAKCNAGLPLGEELNFVEYKFLLKEINRLQWQAKNRRVQLT